MYDIFPKFRKKKWFCEWVKGENAYRIVLPRRLARKKGILECPKCGAKHTFKLTMIFFFPMNYIWITKIVCRKCATVIKKEELNKKSREILKLYKRDIILRYFPPKRLQIEKHFETESTLEVCSIGISIKRKRIRAEYICGACHNKNEFTMLGHLDYLHCTHCGALNVKA